MDDNPSWTFPPRTGLMAHPSSALTCPRTPQARRLTVFQKPVSSLLARFENMSTAQQREQSPTRGVSPAPKPGRLRNFKASHEASSASSKAAIKPSSSLQEKDMCTLPSTKPIPMAKPQGLAIQAPAVTVQPPQSPPKSRAAPIELGIHSPFLDPVPTAGHGGSPSRPPTPLLALSASKSPRLGTSNPPSPPPPRRSGEIRDKEVRQAPAPPAPRSSRTVAVRPQPAASPDPRTTIVPPHKETSQATSPFSSPPTSPLEAGNNAPAELITRSRPRGHSDVSSKPGLDFHGFEPPPLHPSIAMKRMEQSQTPGSLSRGPAASLRASHHHTAHHPKSSNHESAQRHSPSISVAEVPSRPPRTTATPKLDAHALPAPSNRSVSQPLSRQYAALPARQAINSTRPRDTAPDGERSETNSRPGTGTALSALIPESASSTLVGPVTAYPDGANANRRPPFIKKGCHDIQTRFDPRVLDVCGELVCTSGQLTRVWNLLDGEQVLSLAHTEGVKATVVAFKPAPSADMEGSVLWIGTNLGEIMEVEVSTQRILLNRGGVHGRCDVISMYRHVNELWTLDEAGTMHVWGPGADGVPNLSSHPHQTNKLPREHSFSMIVGDELWHASGKAIRVFAPSLDGSRPFQVLVRPLNADGAGDVTAGTQVKTHPGNVFFGHIDGKVSIFSAVDYSCLAVLSISSWKINALAGVGPHMWAAYNTGKMCVYDMSQSPWVVKKDWQAHDEPIMKMKADPSSSYRLDRLQVITLGGDNKVKAWDGLLQDDWLEEDMKSKDVDYCEFEEIKATVMTWNAGASTPHSLRYSDGDAGFFQKLLQSSGSPDIFIFGFQELVDLEDKTATAKRFLKSSKKKEGTDQERMSHQYRDWRDFLMKTLDDYMPAGNLYHLLHSAPLVGLFTCVFVKSYLRERIRNLSAAEVKRGMGGLHGNKGAVAVRFQVDDTSLCFINCHLAAGQSQSSSRHNDVAAILDASLFPAERDLAVRIDSFTGGGDGTMILDHELCVLNGDLNYRIDTMSRDTVVKAVKQQNLAKLLERDQLLISRRRNPAFRLRAFEELPITFAPTYKYDVGTDNYDTSDKKRSPAWCDRLLFRGRGRAQQLDYKRHEVRVSDHRPVTGSFHLWVKKIHPRERATAWMESQQGFEDLRQQEMADEQ